MHERVSHPRKPFFTVAAWFSLLVPWMGVVAGLAASAAPRGIPVPMLIVLAAVFALSFVGGWVSLWGIKANGALPILPPALLGIVSSAILELLTLIFLGLSNLPSN
jgi:hypothetical protein